MHLKGMGKADPANRYKPIGTQTGATENSKDGFETLRVRPRVFLIRLRLTHFPTVRTARSQLDRETPSTYGIVES